MKTKSYALMCASVLALFLVIGSVSAALTIDNFPTEFTDVEHDAGEFTFTFDLVSNEAEVEEIDWSSSTGDITFDVTSIADGLVDSVTAAVTATVTFDAHQAGIIDGTVAVDGETEDFSAIITDSSELSVESKTISKGDSETTITIKNEGNQDLTGITLTQDERDFDVSFSENDFDLDAGKTKDITVTITTNLDDIDLALAETIVTATADDATVASGTISTEGEFYSGENDGRLEVDIDNDFSVRGLGDDDDWFMFDEIEVDVNIDNTGSYDIEDIEIEVCLFDIEEEECVLDEDDMEISENKFDLDENKDEDITITFTLDANDYTENTDKLRLYVKAVGELTGNDAEDAGVDKDETGAEDSEDINVIIESNYVMINEVDMAETASCGDEVTLTADVWNVGTSNQDEVFVKVYNSVLGLNEIIEMDIDSFDSDELSVTISVPEGADEKRYDIKITLFDDEDMNDDDAYEYDDDESEFRAYLTVEGCALKSDVEVSAVAKSGGIAGDEAVVEVTIVNTGSELQTFSLRSIGYESWAESASLDKESFTLESGASEVVLVTLLVNKDASGDNGFDIEVSADGEILESKTILVPIEEYEGIDWSLVGIVALNIVLLLAIILVIVKIVKRRK